MAQRRVLKHGAKAGLALLVLPLLLLRSGRGLLGQQLAVFLLQGLDLRHSSRVLKGCGVVVGH